MSAKAEAGIVLVIDADRDRRAGLCEAIAPEFAARGLAPAELASPAQTLDVAGAVVVLPEDAGEAALATLRPLAEGSAAGALVVVTAARAEDALEAAIGALSPAAVLSLPVSAAALRLALRRAVPFERPGAGARPQHRPARALLGVSVAIRDVMEQVKQLGPAGIPVLIQGETGTGKELVARAIHEHGPEGDGPFVAINCGALPDTLLESELFGFERGAFTGAARAKRGLFEEANGGTLFLDEIGDTSPALQVKLLRAIELGEIRPLGSTRVARTSARIVSATHRDLEEAVQSGVFRQDLLYRLNTATIFVPPLRRRPVDIPFLAQHFAEEFGAAHARRITLSEDFLAMLARRDYPGNVRELRNAVERAITLARPDQAVGVEHLGAHPSAADIPPAGTLQARIERVEREAIQEALTQSGGNRTHAAEALGISRLGLRQKMRRLGLEHAGRRRKSA